jgi:arginine/serine-rich splicing factor 2
MSRRSRSSSRSRSPRRSRSPSRSRSPKRRGKHRGRRPSPRRPSVNEFGRNMTRNYRRKPSPITRRRPSPRRYTIAENGRAVDEFGRNIPRGPPPKKAVGTRFFNEKTRKYKRPIHVFNNVTRTYKPADWNV